MNIEMYNFGLCMILISIIFLLWNYVWLFLLKHIIYLSFSKLQRNLDRYCIKENISFKSKSCILMDNIFNSINNIEELSFSTVLLYTILCKRSNLYYENINPVNVMEYELNDINDRQKEYFKDVTLKLCIYLTMFVIFRSFIATIIFVLRAFISLLKAIVSLVLKNIKITDSIKENMLELINKINITYVLNNAQNMHKIKM